MQVTFGGTRSWKIQGGLQNSASSCGIPSTKNLPELVIVGLKKNK